MTLLQQSVIGYCLKILWSWIL